MPRGTALPRVYQSLAGRVPWAVRSPPPPRGHASLRDRVTKHDLGFSPHQREGGRSSPAALRASQCVASSKGVRAKEMPLHASPLKRPSDVASVTKRHQVCALQGSIRLRGWFEVAALRNAIDVASGARKCTHATSSSPSQKTGPEIWARPPPEVPPSRRRRRR